jgi:integrase
MKIAWMFDSIPCFSVFEVTPMCRGSKSQTIVGFTAMYHRIPIYFKTWCISNKSVLLNPSKKLWYHLLPWHCVGVFISECYPCLWLLFAIPYGRNTPNDITFHGLRQSFGSLVQQTQRDIRITQQLMNHKSIQMTERYTHSRSEAKMKAVNSLDWNLHNEKIPHVS